jgi:hypothetical protein
MDAINTVTTAATQGLPHLFEWGGLVTLLTLLVIMFGCAIVGLCWIIWQMYKEGNQRLIDSIEATNRGSIALEKLTEWIKGKGSTT